jgi:hypothetical protein
MYSMNKWRIIGTLAVVLLAIPRLSISLEATGKKEKWVIGSLDTSGPVPGLNIFRGDFITVTTEVKSEGAVKTEPLKVRISLATDRDGKDIRHEFDIFHDIVLDQGSGGGGGKRDFDGFHQVRNEKGGGVRVSGQYVIPYSIAAGNEYYVVVEVSPETKAGEGEKTKMTHSINIPCDSLPYFDDSTSAKFPAYNFCGERD